LQEKLHEEEVMRRMQSSMAKDMARKKGTTKKSRFHEAALLRFKRQEERRQVIHTESII